MYRRENCPAAAERPAKGAMHCVKRPTHFEGRSPRRPVSKPALNLGVPRPRIFGPGRVVPNPPLYSCPHWATFCRKLPSIGAQSIHDRPPLKVAAGQRYQFVAHCSLKIEGRKLKALLNVLF